MTEIKLFPLTGEFAENKDVAREVRVRKMLPAIDRGEEVILDFGGVTGATQSFIHAMISNVIRKKGILVIDKIYFKNCNSTVQKLINIVVDYMQESL